MFLISINSSLCGIIWHLGGANDKTGTPNAGVFLDAMKVISCHKTALKDIISNHNAGAVNCCSNNIQNEFISMLGKKVRDEIIAGINKANDF
jgi:hypothetical protein